MAAFTKSWRRELRLLARLPAVSHVRHSAMLALTDAESLVSRFVATRVRRGRRKHWLPGISPIASIHRAPPWPQARRHQEQKSCNSGRPKSCNRNNWRALSH